MKDRNNRQGLKEILTHIGVRSLIVTIVVLCITAGIAIYAGTRIHGMQKEILLQKGELMAKKSAMEYNRYLLTRVNLMTRTGFTVNTLLAEDADNEAVKKYLTDETAYIQSEIEPETTGLYGWVQGEYLDGSGWVPDADYIPTERPWYLETLASETEISYVAPYLDAETGHEVMTITIRLADGESVIALDVSLEYIQNMVEHIAATTEGSQALVVDSNGVIVAHSDKSLLGTQYAEETNEDFYIYVDELEGGWKGISLIDTSIWLRPLYRAMTIFFIILGLIVVSILYVLLKMASKNLALQKLYTRIDQEEKRGETLQALAETDRMTGLYDRVNGKAKVEELGAAGMFLELDIDRFKHINDTYGHQAGDAVILAVAEALKNTFRAGDVTMRLGGDEFGAFAVGILRREMGEATIQRLFDRINRLDYPEKISISVGAVICKEPQPFDTLYAAADEAMYRSKKKHGNSVTFH